MLVERRSGEPRTTAGFGGIRVVRASQVLAKPSRFRGLFWGDCFGESRNQHARRVRYPEELTMNLQQLFRNGIRQQFSGTSQREAICLAGKQSIADQSLCLILANRMDTNSLTGAQAERDVLGPFHRWS